MTILVAPQRFVGERRKTVEETYAPRDDSEKIPSCQDMHHYTSWVNTLLQVHHALKNQATERLLLKVEHALKPVKQKQRGDNDTPTAHYL